MTPWIALPLCVLAALCALPVRVGFLKTPGGKPRAGVALGPVRRQWTLSLAPGKEGPALRLASARGEALVPLFRKNKGPASESLTRALRFLARRFRPERLQVELRVRASDARSTVLLATLAEEALAILTAVRPALPLRRRVTCAFAGPGAARLMGIFSARAGHIMLAALFFGREYCIGRLRAWINTPSKTS